MNKILIFILIHFFHQSNAQAPEVKMGPKIKLSYKEMIDGHLLNTPAGYMVKALELKGGLFSKKTNMYLQQYDKKFDLLETNKYLSEDDDVQNIDIIELKNNLFLLSTNKDSKNDFISYNFAPIDIKGKLGRSKSIAKFKFERKKDIPLIDLIRSEDSTLLSMLAYVDNDNNEDIMNCFVSVFDKDMAEKWTKKISLRKPQEVIQIISAAVNNEGKVYILYKEFEGKRAKESKGSKPAYDLKIAISGKESSQLSFKTLDLKSFFVTNADIKVLPDGNIGVFGLSSPTKKHLTNGIFTLKIDQKTDSIFQVSQKEFSAEDLEMLDDEDNTKKDKGDAGLDPTIDLIDISYLKDGSSYVTMEENYVLRSSYYNGRTWVNTVEYISKDIVVIKLDPSSKIEFINTIPKRQNFETDVFNSTTIIANENGYNAIYNDDKDNLKKEIGKRKRYISSLGDCVAVLTNIDHNNKKTRYALFDRDDTRAILLPAKSKKISDNVVFFIAEKSASLFSGSDRRVGTITIK